MRTSRYLAVLATTLVLLVPGMVQAGTATLLYTFGAYPDAQTPAGPLVFDESGNLYGATTFGGTNDVGTVFELSPDENGGWKETILHNFCAKPNCADGSQGNGGLIFDADGNLYGTTVFGGAHGTGTVFRLSYDSDKHAWHEEVLYSFGGRNSGDGYYPQAGLLLDKRGNLYGVTSQRDRSLFWTVFELMPSKHGWKETVLYTFSSSNGVENPLIFNGDQTIIYGENGDVIQLAYSGGQWNESEVYPIGVYGVTIDSNANLYGVSTGFETWDAFELSYQGGVWSENTIYTFANGQAGNPCSTLLFDPTQTHLYGTSTEGGTNGFGTVYELTNSNGTWTLTVLYSFSKPQEAPIYSSLIMDGQGNLYGTSPAGGNMGCIRHAGCGYVYEVTP